jgi:biopolymer transport protein ExbB
MSSARSKWWASRTFAAVLGLWIVLLGVTFVPMATPAFAQDGGAESADVVPTPQTEARPSGLVTLFKQGGQFMWPLLLCSLVALAFIIERLWSFQRARTDTRKLMERILVAIREGDLDGALAECSSTRGPIAAILASGLLKARENRGKEAIKEAIESSGQIELSFLQRGLIVLASITNIAPLVGFLGTVSGMINAFAAIAEAEQVSAKLVAKGIQEALITTATGLAVAIPVQIFHSYFVSRVDRYVIEMEEAAVDLVDALVAKGLLKD